MLSSDELLQPPNEAQIEVIKAELGEDTERFKNNLKLLREWLDFQPHLPKTCGENMLAVYLRGNKHDVNKAKKKLEMFFFWKTKAPHLLAVKAFSEEEMAELEAINITAMPILTPNGHRVIIFKLKDPNPDLFNLTTSLRLSWMMGQFRLYKEHMTAGDLYILDGANMTPAHIAKFLGIQLKTTHMIIQESWFARLNYFYHINTSPALEKLVNLLKLIFKPKLRQRIIVDRGISCLKDIPNECLPKEYGGSQLSSVELMDKWRKCMFDDNKVWLENWENENVLIGPAPKDIEDKYDFDDLQGMQGSFRKLDLD